jgi:large subunit ribosomal protein L16
VRQKGRRFLPPKVFKKLTYGNTGILLLQPIFLNGPQIFRLKLFLKKATRRSDNTFRRIWFYAFPHLPLSRKPDGIRMGKGKGKLSVWFTSLAAGIILFEAVNLRHGRAIYFVKQTTFKLGVLTRFLSVPATRVVNAYSPSRTSVMRSFW